MNSNPPHVAYDIKRGVQNAFSGADMQPPAVSLMAVSTWTRQSGDSISFKNDPTPHARRNRVVEPFLKILALNGMIEAREEPAIHYRKQKWYERLFGKKLCRLSMKG